MASEWEVLEEPHSMNPIVAGEPFTLQYRCRLQLGDGAEHEDWIQIYGEDESLKGEGTTPVAQTDAEYEAAIDFSIGLDPGTYAVHLSFDRSDPAAEWQTFALVVGEDGASAGGGAAGGPATTGPEHGYQVVCYEGCDPQPDRTVTAGETFRITWTATNTGGVKTDEITDAVWIFAEGSQEPLWGGSFTVSDLEPGDYYEAEVEVDTPLSPGRWEIVSLMDYYGSSPQEKRLPVFVPDD